MKKSGMSGRGIGNCFELSVTGLVEEFDLGYKCFFTSQIFHRFFQEIGFWKVLHFLYFCL